MKEQASCILVLGAGISGIGAAKVLAKQGKAVILNDKKKVEESESVKELRSLGVQIIDEDQDISLLDKAQRIVVSPGIPLCISLLKEAKRRGIPVIGEIELAYEESKAPILAVTGTNGKTTTTALLGAVMREVTSHVCVGGNIGQVLSEEVAHIPADGYIVAELSSYQLETVEKFRAKGAIILNITPDHLERHKTMQAYQDAKERIFRNQTEEDFAVLNMDDPAVRNMSSRITGQLLFISQREAVTNGAHYRDGKIYVVKNGIETFLCKVGEIPLPGAHNRENVLAVAALTYALGVPAHKIKAAILKFKAVEHRLEYVRTLEGVSYYNDSKATNPESTVKALEAFENKKIFLIAGGYDKLTDIKPMMELIKQKEATLLLMGEAAQRFKKEAEEAGLFPLMCELGMEEAVDRARKLAKKGDVILLSPASASYDSYRSFEERGTHFKTIVQSL